MKSVSQYHQKGHEWQGALYEKHGTPFSLVTNKQFRALEADNPNIMEEEKGKGIFEQQEHGNYKHPETC